MSYVVAIPSYNRVDTIQQKTLAVLQKYHIPKELIFIFVADQEQKDLYSKIPEELYGELIIAEKGLCNARNFITNYFDIGCNIVSLDDDVSDLYELEEGKLIPLNSLEILINFAFEACRINKLNLWGISPTSNAFFMRPGISTNVKFIVGHMWGVINTGDVYVTMDCKEDYERTLKYVKRDGGVVRLNAVCAKTKLGAKGGIGLAAKERLEINKEYASRLLEQYPDFVRLNVKRPGEILLRPRKNVKEIPFALERKDTRREYIQIRDKKLYKKITEELIVMLDKIYITKLGSSNRSETLGVIGSSMTFGFGYKIAQSPGPYRFNAKHPEILEKLIQFGNCLVPVGWTYDSITVNKNMIANKHKDCKNVGLSVIVGIGAYTGGKLRVWDENNENMQEYNIKNKPLTFNGGLLYHEGTPFNKTRYTFVFYKQNYKGEKAYIMQGC